MSKYALKLEQLVQTDSFGDVLVTIQYDGSGPKIVTANGDGLDPELKHMLDTVLGLVNFALAKEIPSHEVAEQLEIEPEDGVHMPLNDILLVIAASLKEAPKDIKEISPDILMQVVPEMIREFTQNAAHALPGAEEKTNQSESKPEEPENTSDEEPKDNQPHRNSFFGGFGGRNE